MNKYILNNRNYYIINSKINNINLKGIIKNNISEYRILVISKDFSIYNKINLEEKWIEFINCGAVEFSFLGKNASLLENDIDNILVNLHLQNNKKNYLKVITLSEDNLKEIESFFYTFCYGGLSIKNKKGYIKENIIVIDNEDILYNELMKSMLNILDQNSCNT